VIKINLLPPELQRAASLPKLVFYTLTASVTAVMLVGIASLWVWIDKGNLETAVQDRETEVSRLEAQAEQLDRINKDIDYYRERESAIIQIKTRRILWGKKLDQLARLTPEDIWIDRLLMETLDPGEYRWEAGKEQTGGKLVLTCWTESLDPASFTELRSRLSDDSRLFSGLLDTSALPDHFFGDFLGFSPHQWSRLEGSDEELARLESTIQLDLKPLHDPPRVVKPANAQVAAAGKESK